MNYEQALKASKHNPAEVLKVLEGLGVECLACKGVRLALCGACDNTKKVKFSWTPQVGEFVLRQSLGEVNLIIRILSFGMLRLSSESGCTFDEPANKFTPILGWEDIRKILKQAGYFLSITSGASGGKIIVYNSIGTDKIYERYHNNDLQHAVMKVVIAIEREKSR